MTTLRTGRWLAAVAVVGPLAAGAALIPLRGRVDNTNVALLLVVGVVAVAALGHRWGAALAAVSAAAAFNLFHTLPYGSLRIDSTADVETAVLLLAVGAAVGEIALRARQANARVAVAMRDLQSIQGLGRLVADGEDLDYVLLATATELTHLLHLAECRYEHEWQIDRDDRVLPVVQRDGTIVWGPTVWDAERWGFPSDGVTIPVWARGLRQGRYVLHAPVGLPFSTERLAKAAALVDQSSASAGAHAA